MQSQSVGFSKLINLLLLLSEFASWTRKSGDDIIIFADGINFCIKRQRSFKILNILSRLKWAGSLVPTWKITLSGLKCYKRLHVTYSDT